MLGRYSYEGHASTRHPNPTPSQVTPDPNPTPSQVTSSGSLWVSCCSTRRGCGTRATRSAGGCDGCSWSSSCPPRCRSSRGTPRTSRAARCSRRPRPRTRGTSTPPPRLGGGRRPRSRRHPRPHLLDPTSPLYLRYISATSPLHLPISPAYLAGALLRGARLPAAPRPRPVPHGGGRRGQSAPLLPACERALPRLPAAAPGARNAP